ncbi:phosphoribosyl-ATP diphosphatase [Candidatus Phycosocius spiralis]|uniref:phosphoribosyl-ATP diphosphatase n=1 Tax=Candidatus Phycosocius spiralis TaxID=2815099 RepID=A0ABQ4PUT0_9PROT|nr:phosphoribosyl-ATP diphosphatase [Candidatus Phycosocius spiralis]GIU66736.1 phosphoribosyl-ATP pyrophosphatase [Candidatus Phycosocius spiralis]
MTLTLGQALDQLLEQINTKSQADPSTSYTAKLIGQGTAHCAKKLGEEGVELALALVSGSATDVAHEAADLLYHFGVALASRGISGPDVVGVIVARIGRSGLEEKASRTPS